MSDKQENDKKTPWHWEWTRSISVLAIVAVGCYKLFETNLNITVDFPTLLSLLLGFFSVWLASLFYFKATDSSNAFYDNTNKFTARTSEILAKIEAGFGERLKSIEVHNQEVRNHMYRNKGEIAQDLEQVTVEATDAQAQLEKAVEDKDKLIEELTERAGMSEEEVSNFKAMLSEKNRELDSLEEKIRSYEFKIENLNGALKNDSLVNSTYKNPFTGQRSVYPAALTTMYNNRLLSIRKTEIYSKLEKMHLGDEAVNLIRKHSNVTQLLNNIVNGDMSGSDLSLLLTLDFIPRDFNDFHKYETRLSNLISE